MDDPIVKIIKIVLFFVHFWLLDYGTKFCVTEEEKLSFKNNKVLKSLALN